MKLAEIQRRLGCSLHLAVDVQALITEARQEYQSQNNRLREIIITQCRPALSEINACLTSNYQHPTLDAAAEYLRVALDQLDRVEPMDYAPLECDLALLNSTKIALNWLTQLSNSDLDSATRGLLNADIGRCEIALRKAQRFPV